MNTETTSVLIKNQVREYTAEWLDADGPRVVVASVRYDDRCGNGHNSFSITGTVYGPHGNRRDGAKRHAGTGRSLGLESCGCIHETIAAHIPELAPLIKWHLCGSDQPMQYAANTLYLAGDRDCWGLRAGEFRQHTARGQQNGGASGVPNWELEIPPEMERDVYSHECPPPVTLQWKPSGITGDGKDRELDAARRAAIWPEATDAELMQEPEQLKAALRARLPGLMAEFRKMIEGLGFVY